MMLQGGTPNINPFAYGIPPPVPTPPFVPSSPTSEMAAAINDVMSGIKKLEKDTFNAFAKYRYASIDAFLDLIRPLMAQAGLAIITEECGWEVREVTADKGEVRSLFFITYGFRLLHKSGALWPSHPIRRTVTVPAGGAQMWGQAQSYALKQFARATFLIATGEREDDADAQAPIEIKETSSSINPTVSAAAASLFIQDLQDLKTEGELDARFKKLRKEYPNGLTLTDQKAVVKAYNEAIERVTPDEDTA